MDKIISFKFIIVIHYFLLHISISDKKKKNPIPGLTGGSCWRFSNADVGPGLEFPFL